MSCCRMVLDCVCAPLAPTVSASAASAANTVVPIFVIVLPFDQSKNRESYPSARLHAAARDGAVAAGLRPDFVRISPPWTTSRDAATPPPARIARKAPFHAPACAATGVSTGRGA